MHPGRRIHLLVARAAALCAPPISSPPTFSPIDQLVTDARFVASLRSAIITDIEFTAMLVSISQLAGWSASSKSDWLKFKTAFFSRLSPFEPSLVVTCYKQLVRHRVCGVLEARKVQDKLSTGRTTLRDLGVSTQVTFLHCCAVQDVQLSCALRSQLTGTMRKVVDECSVDQLPMLGIALRKYFWQYRPLLFADYCGRIQRDCSLLGPPQSVYILWLVASSGRRSAARLRAQIFEAICLRVDSVLSVENIIGRKKNAPPLKPKDLVLLFSAVARIFECESSGLLSTLSRFERGETISQEVLVLSVSKESEVLSRAVTIVDAVSSALCSPLLACAFSSVDAATCLLRALSAAGLCFVSSAAQILLHLLLRFLLFRYDDVVEAGISGVSTMEDCTRLVSSRISIDGRPPAIQQLSTTQLTQILVTLTTYKSLLHRSAPLATGASTSFFEFYSQVLQPKILRAVMNSPTSHLAALVAAACEAEMLPASVVGDVITRSSSKRLPPRARYAILASLSPYASTHPQLRTLLEQAQADSTSLVGQLGVTCRSGRLEGITAAVEELVKRREGETPTPQDCRLAMMCLAKAGVRTTQTSMTNSVKQLALRWALSSDEALEAVSCLVRICEQPGDLRRLFDVCIDQCCGPDRACPDSSGKMEAAAIVLGWKLGLPVSYPELWASLRDPQYLSRLSKPELGLVTCACVALGDDHPQTLALVQQALADLSGFSVSTAVTLAYDIWVMPDSLRETAAASIGKRLAVVFGNANWSTMTLGCELRLMGAAATLILFGCSDPVLKLHIADFAARRLRDETAGRSQLSAPRATQLMSTQVDQPGGWTAIAVAMVWSQALPRCTDDMELQQLAQNFWKLALKTTEKLATAKTDADSALLTVAIALNLGAGSQVLDSILTKLRLSSAKINLQLLPMLAFGLVGTGKKRPQVAEFIAHILTSDQKLHSLPAHGLRNLILLVNRESDRVAIGHLLSDTVNAALWAALEHKISRLLPGDLLALSDFAPSTMFRNLGETIAERITREELVQMTNVAVPFFLKLCAALPEDARASTVDRLLLRAESFDNHELQLSLAPLRAEKVAPNN